MLEMMRQFYRLEEAINKIGGTSCSEIKESDLQLLLMEWTQFREAVAIMLDRAHGLER